MIEINKDTYYTVQDVSKGLNWPISTLYERMQNGLPFIKVGHKRAIKGSDLINYLDSYRVVERRRENRR